MILENSICEEIILMTKPAATKITHEANKNTQYEYLSEETKYSGS